MQLSAHLTELAPLARPAAAADAGFAMVESWWPPADDPVAWADRVTAAQVGVAAINADGGDIAAGERGFCTNPALYEHTLDAVERALALAGRVDAPVVNVLAGRRLEGVPERDQRGAAVLVLRACGDLARRHGRTIVVEPLNATDVPGYLVSTPAEAARLLDEIGHDHVRLLYDAYHAAMGGIDPMAEVGGLIDYVAHVQYADCPGRGAPGTGTLDLPAFLERLDAAGYTGAVGLEYVTGPDTLTSLADLNIRSWPG
jgi:hydroxypyruvate isomerase